MRQASRPKPIRRSGTAGGAVFDDTRWRILGPYEPLQTGDEGFDLVDKTWRPVSIMAVRRRTQMRNIVYRRLKL